jgi:hypothetical protein
MIFFSFRTVIKIVIIRVLCSPITNHTCSVRIGLSCDIAPEGTWNELLENFHWVELVQSRNFGTRRGCREEFVYIWHWRKLDCVAIASPPPVVMAVEAQVPYLNISALFACWLILILRFCSDLHLLSRKGL